MKISLETQGQIAKWLDWLPGMIQLLIVAPLILLDTVFDFLEKERSINWKEFNYETIGRR